VEVKQDLDDLCGAFGGLSETHHDILVMRELEGLSYREIGERMGMSRPAVESTLFRARRRLTEEYEELVSGQRCVRIQGIIAIAGEAGGKVGSRDTRRLARHVAHCQPCRREAIAAGLDAAVLTLPRHKVAAKVAALLPFPPLGRRWGRGAGTGDRDGWILQLGSMSDHAGPGWAKAAAAAALLLAGAGAGVKVATDAGGAPSHAAARPAQSAGAPSGGGGAAALGARAVRTSGAGTANRLASRVERRSAAGGTSGHAGSAAPTGAVQSGPSSPAAPRPAAATTGPGAGTSGSRTTPTVRDTASGASDTVQAAVGAATGAVSGAAGAVPGAADVATGAAAGTAGTLESVAGDATGVAGNVPPITP
jgi:hypothetical protein